MLGLNNTVIKIHDLGPRWQQRCSSAQLKQLLRIMLLACEKCHQNRFRAGNYEQCSMGQCIDVISSLLSFCLNRIKQLLYVRRSLRSIHKQFEKLHYLADAATNVGNFQRSRFREYCALAANFKFSLWVLNTKKCQRASTCSLKSPTYFFIFSSLISNRLLYSITSR